MLYPIYHAAQKTLLYAKTSRWRASSARNTVKFDSNHAERAAMKKPGHHKVSGFRFHTLVQSAKV